MNQHDGNSGNNYTVTLAGNTSSEILEDRLTGIPLLIAVQYAQHSARDNSRFVMDWRIQLYVTLNFREKIVVGRQLRLVSFYEVPGVLINCASRDSKSLPQCVAFQ